MLRRLFLRVLAFSLSALVVFPAAAQLSQPPEVAAKAYLLVDLTSGQVLAAKDPDQSVEPDRKSVV